MDNKILMKIPYQLLLIGYLLLPTCAHSASVQNLPGGSGAMDALMASCADNLVLKKIAGAAACAADSTGAGSLGSGLASATNDITASGSVIVLAGATESTTWTYTSNLLTVTSTTGVNAITLTGFTITAGTFTGALSGNATTATTATTAGALTADGSDCAAGNAPLGVTAAGASSGCFDVMTQVEGDLKAPLADAIHTSSLQIPNGANPTVDAQGEIAQDTTDDQFIYGSTPRVMSYKGQECALITDTGAATDNRDIWMVPFNVTITSVGCACEGTCSGLATFTLEDQGGAAMTITGTNPTCATTLAATYTAVTAGNVLTTGERLNIDVTNTPNPETDEYIICWTYTVDRQ